MSYLFLAIGWATAGIGFVFLVLALIAAVREVFPRSEHVEQLKRAARPEEFVNLLAEVGKLKTWLALTVVGTALMFMGAAAPAVEKWLAKAPAESRASAQSSK
jgi:hypothetical protein